MTQYTVAWYTASTKQATKMDNRCFDSSSRNKSLDVVSSLKHPTGFSVDVHLPVDETDEERQHDVSDTNQSSVRVALGDLKR